VFTGVTEDPTDLSVKLGNEAELLFTALAELSTRQIAESEKAKGLQSNAKAGKKGEPSPKMRGKNWKPRPEKVL
jgi:hypothetical protein